MSRSLLKCIFSPILPSKIWLRHQEPGEFIVDPFYIARSMYPDIKIMFVDDFEKNSLAVSWVGVENGNYVAKLKKDMCPTRMRFAMAFVLGRVLYDTDLPAYDTDESYKTDNKNKEILNLQQFALKLLLPKKLVRAVWRVGGNPQVGIIGLSKMFNVSQAAMFNRLQDLHIIPRNEQVRKIKLCAVKARRAIGI